MNKKQYIFPSLTVVEIEVQDVLQGIVSGGAPSDGLDIKPGSNPDPEDGEDMSAAMRGGFFDWN